MEFSIRFQDYTCECGTKPLIFLGVGTTSLGELVVFWFCKKCKCKVMCRTPLETLISNLPPQPEQKMIAPPVFSAEDTKMFAEMHIKLGDEDEAR